ncbi:MAG: bifunctional folylpolyglutamate synthase/dihydrofolate synthase [Coriobacteriales bacterium]|nr:bifunctional folylpolyglutamate synthase/dihydrofolate synthase [Coriobacteriales bacterium]
MAEDSVYQASLKRLKQALTFGIDPSLDGIAALMEAFGNPQTQLACVQIAGTNGKSSTSRMTAALLIEEGFHVGLYTSPELVDYPERIEVDGRVIEDDYFGSTLLEVADVADRLAATPGKPDVYTEFELLTATALLIFYRAGVDFAVLECGMGGRWDATSVCRPAVATITGIGLDHIHILGDTVQAIAAEKAAIIRPACSVVLGPGCAETQEVFLDRVAACDTYARVVRPWDQDLFPSVPRELQVLYRSYDDLLEGEIHLDVWGIHALYEDIRRIAAPYQLANIACAIATVESLLGRKLDQIDVLRAIRDVRLPGRFDTLRSAPLLIIDAAHNPQGAQVLAQAIQVRFPDAKPHLLLAVLKDKDATGIIEALAPVVSGITVTQTSSHRAMPAPELAALVERLSPFHPDVFDTPAQAVEALRSRGVPVVASGSITLAGAVAGYEKDGRC